VTCALLGSTGAVVSAVFAVCSLQPMSDRQRQAAWLYAVDLAGGAAGSLAASLLLIPMAGLTWTLGSVPLAALGLLLLA
jgi:hypothetical protein